MKKLSFALLFALASTFGKAQTVPQGMNYQAIARNLNGEVLVNQPVSLKIDLYKGPQESSSVFYSETHAANTNQLGLFTLIIGSGKPVTGTFSKVPWSTEEVWINISIKTSSQDRYSVINSTKLLAVPYAFHAGTAAELVGNQITGQSPAPAATETNFWRTVGNAGHSEGDRLGSTDSTDLVLITNNKQRIKITAGGNLQLDKLAHKESAEPMQVLANADGELFTRKISDNVDSLGVKIIGGKNLDVSGDGTASKPYVINANMDSITASPLDRVIATGNTTTGNIVFENDDNFIETKPSNYNESVKQGKFSMAVKEFPGVNGSGSRSNVVGSFWGYNTTPGGGQSIQGEAAYRFAGETFFDVGGRKVMEFHLPEMHTNSGHGLRPFSMYIDRETGIGSADYQMHQFNFKKVNDASIDWMRMRNDAGDIRIEMQPEAGGSSYLEMNGRGETAPGSANHNKAFIVNSGNGLSFVNSSGNFKFNNGLEIEGGVSHGSTYANNTDASTGSTAHTFLGRQTNNRLLSIGDDAYSEKFYITPTSVISSLNFLSMGKLEIGGSIAPANSGDLNIKFNTAGNNAKLNFVSDAGNVMGGQVSVEGVYAKTIQTEKPLGAESAAKLKVGNVVSATIRNITSKFLQIEIDGVSYKIPLID
ncbi:hypothetical protein EXU57_16160 [Segetibacter sp. 3557_3]|uniref:hypothetical protein n=1 Tax=Segetibacter sp. 3557_3 TaxID=2547429 RepID=UPI0010587502|nr:hypothetical protein [Segetibacter sp. 3557_3]TDH24020.1 hypothetical protein EXU57_16160 [Segetibacter sp. 3557_3]